MRRFRLFLAALVLGAGGGCGETARQHAAQEYQKEANATFKETEVRDRLWRRAEARFPGVRAVYRDAFRQGKKIIGPKFQGRTNFGYPAKPKQPLEKLWVTLLIDRDGRVAAADCTTEGETPLDPARETLVTTTVMKWTFTPMTIDGEPAACINIFPAATDGVEFYVSAARELQ